MVDVGIQANLPWVSNGHKPASKAVKKPATMDRKDSMLVDSPARKAAVQATRERW